MCGICARVGPDPTHPALLRRMSERLSHRGPDGAGMVFPEGAGLGHRRLSIIDIDGGAQPMSNAAGTRWIVFNGEIYNHAELRAELESRGHRFRTRSDTEVILQLHEAEGDDAVRRLRGMFAFVIWDSVNRRLFAARDHLGQKPLYYAHRGEELLIASEIKALLAADPSLREVDARALDEYLALRLVPAPLSMFRGIRKLPPAHAMTFDASGRLSVKRYWDVNYEPKRDRREDDLIDELEERLVDTLRAHLVSDVPVGAFLSGGMDSGLLVALLRSRGLLDDLPTFTVGLPYGRFDEAPAARSVAAAFATRHHEEQAPPDLLEALPRVIEQLDEPSDPLAVCMDLVARLASRHVKVVLGGDGGDELFGGYDRYYGNHYAERYARLPAMIRQGVGAGLAVLPEGRWYKSAGHQLRWLHRLAEHEGGDRYVESLQYFYLSTEWRKRLYGPSLLERLDEPPGRRMRDGFNEAPAREALDRMLYADLQSRLPDHPVMIQDRLTMAHGLEARSPYMDHRLVEFVARLPARMKVRGRTLRYAQQRLAQRYLPADVLSRKKQGFASALPYLVERDWPALHDVFLDNMHLVRDGWLDDAGVRSLWHEHREGRHHANRLWLLINAEAWYRVCVHQQSAADLTAELHERRRRTPPQAGATIATRTVAGSPVGETGHAPTVSAEGRSTSSASSLSSFQ